MTEPELKLPKKGGLAEVRKRLKEIYEKPPSEELVDTIAEIGHEDENDKSNDRGEIAARPYAQPSQEMIS